VLIEKFLHNCRENFLGNSGANLYIMLTVLEDLWLDDWHETVLLTDRAVSGEGMSSLSDSGLSWASTTNFEDSSPFREPASQSVVFSASLAKSIKTLGGSLTIGSANWDETSVNLDTAMNSSSSQDVGELL